MRFPRNKHLKPSDQRIVRKFLWWPKSLNSNQYRWLEFAKIKECVRLKDYWGILTYDWEEVEFVD